MTDDTVAKPFCSLAEQIDQRYTPETKPFSTKNNPHAIQCFIEVTHRVHTMEELRLKGVAIVDTALLVLCSVLLSTLV